MLSSRGGFAAEGSRDGRALWEAPPRPEIPQVVTAPIGMTGPATTMNKSYTRMRNYVGTPGAGRSDAAKRPRRAARPAPRPIIHPPAPLAERCA